MSKYAAGATEPPNSGRAVDWGAVMEDCFSSRGTCLLVCLSRSAIVLSFVVCSGRSCSIVSACSAYSIRREDSFWPFYGRVLALRVSFPWCCWRGCA